MKQSAGELSPVRQIIASTFAGKDISQRSRFLPETRSGRSGVVCPRCGGPKEKKSVNCRKCYWEIRASVSVVLPCSNCGKDVEKKRYDLKKAAKKGYRDIYCGSACAQAHHAIKNRRRCITCGDPVSKKTRKYCEKCKPKPRGRVAIRALYEGPCDICQRTFRRRVDSLAKKVYCSRDCANKAHSRRMAGKGNPKWRNGASPLRQQPHSARAYRTMRPRILERDGHRCVVCLREESLHVHHIDQCTMNNASSNLVTLCCSCHRKWHAAWDSKANLTLWPWLSEYAKKPLSTISK